MWFLLTINSAFFNAIWTAFSKYDLQKISPYNFTVGLRIFTALLLFPLMLFFFELPTEPVFWIALIFAGVFEAMGIYAQSEGVKRDFYSTYSMANTAPFFTLIFAYFLIHEQINSFVILGSLSIMSGGIIFFRLKGRFLFCGILRAIGSAGVGVFSKIALQYSTPYVYPPMMFFVACFIFYFNPMKDSKEIREVISANRKSLLLLALCSAIATFSYYTAIKLAPVTRVNPLMRINLIFGFIIGFYFLKERNDIIWKLIGSGFIFIGTVFITLSY